MWTPTSRSLWKTTVAVEVDGNTASHSSARAVCDCQRPLELKLGIVTTLLSRAENKAEERPTSEKYPGSP